MSQISDGHLDRFDVLRNDIEQSLEELVASRIHSGEVVELAGKILLAGGKRLRPIMMFLAYELAGGNKPQDLMALAMGFELLHTATLIHDDINDQATHRRGVPTIHTDYGLAKAIIAGDWLFVQGYSLGGRYDQEIVTIIGNYCSEIAVSEFSQIEHINNLRTTPEDYLNIVKGKTAGPFSGGCRAAAVIAGASEEDKIALSNFGMEIGIAYQLVDDLLDLKGDESIGKPRGSDVHEGKMTLPLIHSLTLLHGSNRERLAEIIRNFSYDLFDELIELLEKSDSFTYTEILIQNHFDRAIKSLEQFSNAEVRNHLIALSVYITKRKI
jgi:geranylgeranyl pyrophosphate synthase